MAISANFYNTLFPQKRLDMLSARDRDFYNWLVKADDLYGDGTAVKMRISRGQGQGSTLGQAQENGTAALVAKVLLERQRYFSSVSISHEDAKAAEKNGGPGNVKEMEIEDCVVGLTMEMESHLLGAGNGVKGTISAITSAVPSVITLSDPEDAANFSIGEVLESRSSAAADRGGDEAITSIDYDTGKLTMTTNVVADHAWQATDGLVRGSATSGSSYGAVVQGLGSWFPTVAETSGTFLTADRTIDVVQMQGHRQAYLGSIEETIKKLRSKMTRFAARPDCCWLSESNWHRLEQELGARAVRTDGTAATFGLPSLKYASSKGPISIYSAAMMGENAGYLLTRSSLTLHHMGQIGGIKQVESNVFHGTEVQVSAFAELGCDAPVQNGVFVIG